MIDVCGEVIHALGTFGLHDSPSPSQPWQFFWSCLIQLPAKDFRPVQMAALQASPCLIGFIFSV